MGGMDCAVFRPACPTPSGSTYHFFDAFSILY
nr:MAG TPA: hypothetical protein [Caudoviricetes sp.]